MKGIVLTMDKYKQIRTTEDHTNQQKEFYQAFPYQQPIQPQDYTVNKELKEDQDWLAEKGCSPEYKKESTTFEDLIAFIELNEPVIREINCIPKMVGRTVIRINYIFKGRNERFLVRKVVLQKLRDYLNNLPYYEQTKGEDDILYSYKYIPNKGKRKKINIKNRPNKTHYYGINTGNNFMYQPYNPDQC